MSIYNFKNKHGEVRHVLQNGVNDCFEITYANGEVDYREYPRSMGQLGEDVADDAGLDPYGIGEGLDERAKVS